MNAIYVFEIPDSAKKEWYLDLKSGSGRLEEGKFDGKPDCKMTMDTEVFNKMVSGKLKPTSAFMSGKLKIKGNMGQAMKLEKLMASLNPKL